MNSEKMITVDLTKEHINIQSMPEYLTHNYIGGEGTGTRLLWEMVQPGTDALSPANAIVFATGPLNGTTFPADGLSAADGNSMPLSAVGSSNGWSASRASASATEASSVGMTQPDCRIASCVASQMASSVMRCFFVFFFMTSALWMAKYHL